MNSPGEPYSIIVMLAAWGVFLFFLFWICRITVRKNLDKKSVLKKE